VGRRREPLARGAGARAATCRREGGGRGWNEAGAANERCRRWRPRSDAPAAALTRAARHRHGVQMHKISSGRCSAAGIGACGSGAPRRASRRASAFPTPHPVSATRQRLRCSMRAMLGAELAPGARMRANRWRRRAPLQRTGGRRGGDRQRQDEGAHGAHVGARAAASARPGRVAPGAALASGVGRRESLTSADDFLAPPGPLLRRARGRARPQRTPQGVRRVPTAG